MAKKAATANGLDLNAYPAYREERAKYDELSGRLTAATEKLAALEASLTAPGRGRSLMAVAEGIIDRMIVPLDLPSLDKLGQARDEVDALALAVGVQKQALAEARGDASIEICEPLVAEHRARVQRIHAALLELSEAIKGEQDLRDKLDGAGVDRGAMIPVCTFAMAGRMDFWNSPMAIWARTVTKMGFLTDG